MGGHQQLAALVIVVAACWAAYRTQGPSPLPPEAPTEAFSAGRASKLLQRLVPEPTPHPTGTEANVGVRERLVQQLSKVVGERGTVTVDRKLVCHNANCAVVHNVIAMIGASDLAPATKGDSEPLEAEAAAEPWSTSAVMLTAHYDSVGAGPGISDDAVGVVAVLESTRAILASSEPRRHALLVAFTDGEELGLLGARALADSGRLAPVWAVVNFEARGIGGASYLFETGAANRWMIERYQRHASRPAAHSAYAAVYGALPNDTDFSVYKERGLSGANFGYIRGIQSYHTPKDTFQALDTRSLQHHGEQALAMLRGLLTEAELRPSPEVGDAIYADIGQLTLWVTDRATLRLVMVFVLIAWLFIIAWGVRVHWWRWWQPLGGVVTNVLGIVAAAALGFGIDQALIAVSGHRLPWWDAFAPSLILLWSATMALVVASRRVEARYLGGLAAWVGCWLTMTILALLLVEFAPGFSPLLALPAVVGLIAAGIGRWFPAVGWAIAGTGVVVVWVPLAAAMSDAVGASFGLTVTVPAWFLLVPLAAGRVPARGSWIWPSATALVAAGITIFTVSSGTSQVALLAIQQDGEPNIEVGALVTRWGAGPVAGVGSALAEGLSGTPKDTVDWAPVWFEVTQAAVVAGVPVAGPRVTPMPQKTGLHGDNEVIARIEPQQSIARVMFRSETAAPVALRELGEKAGPWVPVSGKVVSVHGLSKAGIEVRFRRGPLVVGPALVALELYPTMPESLAPTMSLRNRSATTMHMGDLHGVLSSSGPWLESKPSSKRRRPKPRR